MKQQKEKHIIPPSQFSFDFQKASNSIHHGAVTLEWMRVGAEMCIQRDTALRPLSEITHTHTHMQPGGVPGNSLSQPPAAAHSPDTREDSDNRGRLTDTRTEPRSHCVVDKLDDFTFFSLCCDLRSIQIRSQVIRSRRMEC